MRSNAASNGERASDDAARSLPAVLAALERRHPTLPPHGAGHGARRTERREAKERKTSPNSKLTFENTNLDTFGRNGM